VQPGRDDLLTAIERGVAACRRSDWDEGLKLLGAVAAAGGLSRDDLPAAYYSYLGYGIARYQGKRREGVKLCQHAVKLEFYRGEHYFNLARTYVEAGNKAAAVRAVKEGLAVEPENDRLKWLADELGSRKSPVIPFLSRSNPVNVFLGRLRHRLTEKPSD
jgi:tetratricopeptide (TPR) repeat protein